MADAIPLALGSALRRGRSQLVQTRGDHYPSGLRLEVNDSALVLGKETTVVLFVPNARQTLPELLQLILLPLLLELSARTNESRSKKGVERATKRSASRFVCRIASHGVLSLHSRRADSTSSLTTIARITLEHCVRRTCSATS